jgi:trimeric autotransporter adhesin
VDGRAVLDAVAAMPISTWNYIAQDESIRHIGPMAQDFYAAFGVGEDDTHITTIDGDGVALAAIQGLNEIVQEKEAHIAALEARLTALEQGTVHNPVTSLLAAPWPWLALCIITLGGMALWRRKEGGV